jgi:hypothetical protein
MLQTEKQIFEEGSLALRIGVSLIRKNIAQLCQLDCARNPKDVWTKVRELTKLRAKETIAPPGISAQVLNAHYAAISTDSNYQPSLSKISCSANSQWI